MKKNFVIAEKAIELFRDELEGMFAAAEGCPEDSAYWWTRITEGKAEATPDGKVLIEVAPEQVERLLRERFEQSFDESNLQQVCDYLGLLCPPNFEVGIDEDGNVGVLVADVDNYLAISESE